MSSNKDVPKLGDKSLRRATTIAGLGYLGLTILAAFANFYVLQTLIVSGDAATTTRNITASNGLFRAGIASFLIVAILDLVVAWALYALFKPVNKSVSSLMALFRIIYATILAASLTGLVNVLQLLSGATYLNAFETDQVQAQVLLSVNSFMNGWNIALVIFGLHLLTLGYLIFKSGYLSRIPSIVLSVLLIVSALGYLADGFGKILLSNYNITIASFTFIGEVLLLAWLLWRGLISRKSILGS